MFSNIHKNLGHCYTINFINFSNLYLPIKFKSFAQKNLCFEKKSNAIKTPMKLNLELSKLLTNQKNTIVRKENCLYKPKQQYYKTVKSRTAHYLTFNLALISDLCF